MTLLTRSLNAVFWRPDALPRPAGRGQVSVAGPDPDRILLLGGGPAVGWGVTIHDLGLPGFLARWLTAATGRGAEVSVIAEGTTTVRAARRAVNAADLQRFDSVVLTLGVEDAVHGIRPWIWRSQLESLIVQLRADCPTTTSIFVAGIQPVRSIPRYDSPRARHADRRAGVLNSLTAAICAELPDVTFVPMIGAGRTPAQPGRTSKSYSRWAWLLVEPIAAQRSAAVPSAAETGHAESRRSLLPSP